MATNTVTTLRSQGVNFKVENASGTLVETNGGLSKADLNRDNKAENVTVLGADNELMQNQIKVRGYSISGPSDSSVIGLFSEWEDGNIDTARNIEYSPQGTATGKPKYTGVGILTGFTGSAVAESAQNWTGEIHMNSFIVGIHS